MTLGHGQQNLVTGAFLLVVLPKLFPKPDGLYTHDGIDAWIVIGRTTEYLGPNRILLHLGGEPSEGLGTNIFKKLAQSVSRLKDVRAQHSVQLLSLLFQL